MIKKIFIAILLCFSIFSLNFNFNSVNADCTYNENGGLASELDNCFKGTKLIQADNLKVNEKGFKEKIIDWRNRIAFFIGIFAVFGLAFAGFKLVTSGGNDEQISKAKEMIKWILIGILGVLFALPIITLVINTFYSI